jgi:hypothetical protein
MLQHDILSVPLDLHRAAKYITSSNLMSPPALLFIRLQTTRRYGTRQFAGGNIKEVRDLSRAHARKRVSACILPTSEVCSLKFVSTPNANQESQVIR